MGFYIHSLGVMGSDAARGNVGGLVFIGSAVPGWVLDVEGADS